MTRTRTVALVGLLMMSSVAGIAAADPGEYATHGAAEANAADGEIPHNVCADPGTFDVVEILVQDLEIKKCWTLIEPGGAQDSDSAWNMVKSLNNSYYSQSAWANGRVEGLRTRLKSESINAYRNAILNGSTESEALTIAQNKIFNLSVPVQRQMIAVNNDLVGQQAFVALNNSDRVVSTNGNGDEAYSGSLVNETVNLLNGETAERYQITTSKGSGTGHHMFKDSQNTGYLEHKGVKNISVKGQISAPEGGFVQPWNNLSSYVDQANQNLEDFYQNTDPSDFSGNMTMTPEQFADQAAKNHSGYTAMYLANSGVPMNTSQEATIRHDVGGSSTEYVGLVGLSESLREDMSTTGDLPWTTDQTIHLDNRSGYVTLVETGTSQTQTLRDGDVTLLESGTNSSSLTFDTYEFDASNTSATLDEIRQYEQATRNASGWDSAVDDDDGGVPPFNVSGWGIMEWAAVISAIIGVILLIAAAARSN